MIIEPAPTILRRLQRRVHENDTHTHTGDEYTHPTTRRPRSDVSSATRHTHLHPTRGAHQYATTSRTQVSSSTQLLQHKTSPNTTRIRHTPCARAHFCRAAQRPVRQAPVPCARHPHNRPVCPDTGNCHNHSAVLSTAQIQPPNVQPQAMHSLFFFYLSRPRRDADPTRTATTWKAHSSSPQAVTRNGVAVRRGPILFVLP